MPCRSDYLEPTEQEKELRRAAKLLVWLMQTLGQTPDEKFVHAAKSPYGAGVDAVPSLCATIKGLDASQLEAIVYNPHSRMSRNLANWWERHQKEDAKREAKEDAERKRQEFRKSGLARLTKEEREALGI